MEQQEYTNTAGLAQLEDISVVHEAHAQSSPQNRNLGHSSVNFPITPQPFFLKPPCSYVTANTNTFPSTSSAASLQHPAKSVVDFTMPDDIRDERLFELLADTQADTHPKLAFVPSNKLFQTPTPSEDGLTNASSESTVPGRPDHPLHVDVSSLDFHWSPFLQTGDQEYTDFKPKLLKESRLPPQMVISNSIDASQQFPLAMFHPQPRPARQPIEFFVDNNLSSPSPRLQNTHMRQQDSATYLSAMSPPRVASSELTFEHLDEPDSQVCTHANGVTDNTREKMGTGTKCTTFNKATRTAFAPAPGIYVSPLLQPALHGTEDLTVSREEDVLESAHTSL